MSLPKNFPLDEHASFCVIKQVVASILSAMDQHLAMLVVVGGVPHASHDASQSSRLQLHLHNSHAWLCSSIHTSAKTCILSCEQKLSSFVTKLITYKCSAEWLRSVLPDPKTQVLIIAAIPCRCKSLGSYPKVTARDHYDCLAHRSYL